MKWRDNQFLQALVVIAVAYRPRVQDRWQRIESPLLLGKTVDLHPIIIIANLLIGAEVYGILGVLLAVPVALCISAVVDGYRDAPKAHPINGR